MKTNNLDKNIRAILQDEYVVPLYQRNFAWGDEEISQLLQDIYESFRKDRSGNYYIGSLVVIRRSNGAYEVIDGQQRLTAITLISKILDPNIETPKLFYDSRPEVVTFFNSFYQTKQTNNITFDYKVSHLINAVDFIENAKLNSDDNSNITIKSLNNDADAFKTYFFNNVILVFVELPAETDVASYFEIMNNRGQQLQKHEILKAYLLDKIKKNDKTHDTDKQKIYSRIWDACSQMNVHIQKLFDANDRKILFGDDYSEFPNKEKIEKLLHQNIVADYTQQPYQSNKKSFSINEILSNSTPDKGGEEKKSVEDGGDGGNNESIIDFPNFLMHIFKLEYQTEQIEIQLNEKYLLDTYYKIESAINDAEKFIADLFYYRTIFDKYIIKTRTDENSEDKYKWTLRSPDKAENKNSLSFKNTFDDHDKQERIIKCLSMLQVTFGYRTYKHWMQEVLKWFVPTMNSGDIDKIDYRKKLDNLILSCYKIENEIDNSQTPYAKGTDTPHFLFNFIDYLYWVAKKSNYNDNKNDSEKIENLDNVNVNDFTYKYRNSVEHHLPQSDHNYANEIKDNIGNLCLVSKSLNSRMNNESPIGKAYEKGKYYNSKLSPKRQIMYDITNKQSKWAEDEIKQHYNDVVYLLKQRNDILK
jgi:uncharacterized protein with ParB-like and HNH nuclease domain